MDDYDFLDTNAAQSNSLAAYLNRRSEIRKETIESGRNTSIGVLSLSRSSFLDSNARSSTEGLRSIDTQKINSDDSIASIKEKLRKYETPRTVKSPTRLKAEQLLGGNIVTSQNGCQSRNETKQGSFKVNSAFNELFTQRMDPETPRYFREALDSFTPLDNEEPMTSYDSLQQFPIRSDDEVLKFLSDAEKKFINGSFHHNSAFSSFSEPISSQSRSPGTLKNERHMSIGEFFGHQSDSLSFLNGIRSPKDQDKENPKNRDKSLDQDFRLSTISNIRKLLSEPSLSATCIGDRLLEMKYDNKNFTNPTLASVCSPLAALNLSRHSTPLPPRNRQHGRDFEATPLRKGSNWHKGRLALSSSSQPIDSNVSDNPTWQPLRTILGDDDSNSIDKEKTLSAIQQPLDTTLSVCDFTIMSQLIEQKQKRSRSLSTGDSPLLAVIQKLADLPSGTVDCTALTPLLRNQFPDILVDSRYTDQNETRKSLRLSNCQKLFNDLSGEPGSWIQLDCTPINVSACIRTEKTVSVPLSSLQQWVLVRLSGVELIVAGETTRALIDGDSFIISNILSLRAKNVVLPPGTNHSIDMSILCHNTITATVNIHLLVVDLLTDKQQYSSSTFNLTASLPSHEFSFLPPHSFNFGILPENCYLDRSIKLTYVGKCDVPLRLNITQKGSTPVFSILKRVTVNDVNSTIAQWNDNVLELTLQGEEKQIVEFFVRFYPQDIPNLKAKGKIQFEESIKAELQVIGNAPAVMAEISLIGSAAYAKFLSRVDSSPFIFHSKCPGLPVTRSFYLKNDGAVPLDIALQVFEDSKGSSFIQDSPFIVPKKIVLPMDGEVSFDITFIGRAEEGCVKALLVMFIEPNGRLKHEVELIGTVSVGSECSSRSSKSSVTYSTGVPTDAFSSVKPLKLTASTTALSWPATALQQSSVQSFQVKLKGTLAATVRITFNKDSDAFKMINEKGEALSKVRKTLKPDTPVTINVRFKPSSINLHTGELTFDFSGSSKACKVFLTGYGGSHKLRVEDTQSDFHGYKMIQLVPHLPDTSLFTTRFRVTNYGSLRGFVLIQPSSHILSVANSFKVYPQEVVIDPNSNIIFNVSHHISRSELRDILSSQDVRKIATLSILIGDEPSRHRLRRWMSNYHGQCTDIMTRLANEYPGECKIELNDCKESKDFPTIFLKSLKAMDVAVVVEKRSAIGDQTVLELDESDNTFNTIVESTVLQPITEDMIEKSSKSTNNTTYYSSRSNQLSNKVEDWLKSVKYSK